MKKKTKAERKPNMERAWKVEDVGAKKVEQFDYPSAALSFPGTMCFYLFKFAGFSVQRLFSRRCS